jgi:ATP-dependent Clp protease ATP-binding subunit ClpC
MPRLSHEGRRLLGLAEDRARAGDSDHLGTEHIVLGIIAHEPGAASILLRTMGITGEVFLAQLYDEDGHAPASAIPLTPRALMIVALAGSVTQGSVSGLHLLKGVIAESDDWRASGRPGPHHLRDACDTVGAAWADLDRMISERLQSP